MKKRSKEERRNLQKNFLKQYVEKNPKVLEVVLKYKDLLSNFMDREISEIEIDYIVIHICAALERRKKKEVEFRVLIVCGGGIGTSQLLLAKMRNCFDFHVVDMVSAHLVDNKKYLTRFIYNKFKDST